MLGRLLMMLTNQIETYNIINVIFHEDLAFFFGDLPPCLLRVDSHTFCYIISVKSFI